MKLKLKKGDMVQVIAGNDRGAVGRILAIYPDKMKVLVEGVNVRKRHTRPTQQNPKGGIISKEMPIHYSNIMILDSDKNPTRIGIRFEERDGESIPIRYSKKNGKDL